MLFSFFYEIFKSNFLSQLEKLGPRLVASLECNALCAFSRSSLKIRLVTLFPVTVIILCDIPKQGRGEQERRDCFRKFCGNGLMFPDRRHGWVACCLSSNLCCIQHYLPESSDSQGNRLPEGG